LPHSIDHKETVLHRLTRAPEWIVLLPFALSRIWLLVIGQVAAAFPGLAFADEAAGVWTARRWLDVWFRWDSGHYARLVERGYALPPELQASTAFFPLYPTLTRWLYRLLAPDGPPGLVPHTAAGDTFILAGVLLSNLCFVVALVLVYRLAGQTRPWPGAAGAAAGDATWPQATVAPARRNHAGYLAALYLCIAPASFVFSSYLTESLFLLLTVGAFYAAERRVWPAAGLLAGLAALTRSLGVFVALPLAVLWWQQRRRGEARLWQLLPLLLAPLGLALFMLILDRGVGDPLAFMHQGERWGMARAWPWTAFLSDSAARARFDPIDRGLTLLFTGLALLAFRLGPAYGLWALIGTVGALALKGNPTSMLRYTVVVFPAFLVLAEIGRRHPRVHDAVLVSSTVLLTLLMALSAENFWVT